MSASEIRVAKTSARTTYWWREGDCEFEIDVLPNGAIHRRGRHHTAGGVTVFIPPDTVWPPGRLTTIYVPVD